MLKRIWYVELLRIIGLKMKTGWLGDRTEVLITGPFGTMKKGDS